MSKNFDELIEQKQTELISLKEEMEGIRLKFVGETATLISQWFEPQAKTIIQNDIDRSLKLENNELEKIKSKVKELTENAHEIAEKFLSDPKIWWHLSQDKDLYYGFQGNRAPEHVDKGIRLALGSLAPILEEFGYLKNQQRTGNVDLWREWDASGNRKIVESRPYYSQSFNWSQEMRDTINSYAEKIGQARKNVGDIMDLEVEKKRAQLTERWDSI